VSALISRLRLLGYIDRAPDNRLKPGKRFFERNLAENTVQAGLPTPAQGENTEVMTIDDFLVEKPSETVLVKVKGD
jgi:repressor LexA